MTGACTVVRPMTPLEWGLLLTLSVLWGGSFFFVGVAVQELPPLTIVTVRVVLAALALHVVVRVMGVHLPAAPSVWIAFLGMGLLNNVVPFVLIVWGQTHVASGLASILNATTPLFTVIVAQIVTTDEEMTSGRLFGVVAGFAGVAVMIGGAALQAREAGVVAQFGILLAALSYAFAGVFGRRFGAMGVAPLVTATGQVTSSSIVLLPAMLIVDHPWTLSRPSMKTFGALVGLALLSTALAYIFYFRILASAGATNLLLVTFLIPVSATLLGILVLDESLEVRHALGMALIGAGLAAVDGRRWRAVRARTAAK